MEPLSLDQLLSPVPPNLLNQKITSDIHLDKIAQSLGNWKAAIAYLCLSDADEEAIEEENAETETEVRKRKYGSEKKSRLSVAWLTNGRLSFHLIPCGTALSGHVTFGTTLHGPTIKSWPR